MTSPTDPTNPYQQGAPGSQGPDPAYNPTPPPTGSPYQQPPSPGADHTQPPPAYGQQPPPAYGQQPPPAYGQQPPPGYGQPPAVYGPASAEDLNNVKLNLWLSAFIPIVALIFYLTQKDGPAQVKAIHRDTLNFAILRFAVAVFTAIPFIGWIFGGIAGLVLFVFAIIAAVKAPDEVAAGRVNNSP